MVTFVYHEVKCIHTLTYFLINSIAFSIIKYVTILVNHTLFLSFDAKWDLSIDPIISTI